MLYVFDATAYYPRSLMQDMRRPCSPSRYNSL
jgi:hypothetical protein